MPHSPAPIVPAPGWQPTDRDDYHIFEIIGEIWYAKAKAHKNGTNDRAEALRRARSLDHQGIASNAHALCIIDREELAAWNGGQS